MVLRRFLPVGQGAFYLEQFENDGERINVIYDCGSLTDVKIVEKEIRANFDKGEEIRTVFISHVDQDHINGLEYLLKYCRVKSIVFPYTSKKDRIPLTIEYLCKNNNPSYDSFTYKFINDPYNTTREMGSEARLFAVRGLNENDGFNREEHLEYEGIRILDSGENFAKMLLYSKTISKIDWEYVPFNFREEERKNQFSNELKKTIGFGLERLKINNLSIYWNDKKIREAIIGAYKKVKGSLNTNSMVLFSGIRNEHIYQRHVCLYDYHYNNWRFCPYKDCCDCVSKRNGCLYTGDYEANGKYKWNDLKNAFSEYWDYIGCVQIPHHGSYKNYNSEFALFDAYFVISAGLKNIWHHPSGSVIKDLLSRNHYPFIVTEQRNSEVILEIDK